MFKINVQYHKEKDFETTFPDWASTVGYLNSRLGAPHNVLCVKKITLEVIGERPISSLKKGQQIEIFGWHPDSMDEEKQHPHSLFEWFLVGVGHGTGMFQFQGTNNLDNSSTYEARRDLSEENCQLIDSRAKALGLSIDWPK